MFCVKMLKPSVLTIPIISLIDKVNEVFTSTQALTLPHIIFKELTCFMLLNVKIYLEFVD